MTPSGLCVQRALPSLEMIRDETPSAGTMAKVNRYTLRTMAPEDVHVRSAFIINDGVDDFWSRFPVESIETVARIMPGAPMVVGHRRDMSPIARWFDGERVQRAEKPSLVQGVGEGHWARVAFYWMRGHSRAEDLAVNIDGGIERETSLRWMFDKPICAIDKRDIRECEHMPGELYDGRRSYYEMLDVKRVVEGSLVFRGAQLQTELSLMRVNAEKTPAQVVDAFLKESGMRVTDEEHHGLVEFARCYDTRGKLSKKERAGRSWFGNLPKRESKPTAWSK